MAWRWIAAWALFTGLGCGASEATQQARDPMKCERDPACAKARLAYPDCTKQCVDDPVCVERCAEVESTSDGLGH
jgi:hypothetical protein